MGVAVCALYFGCRKEDRLFRPMWLYILLFVSQPCCRMSFRFP